MAGNRFIVALGWVLKTLLTQAGALLLYLAMMFTTFAMIFALGRMGVPGTVAVLGSLVPWVLVLIGLRWRRRPREPWSVSLTVDDQAVRREWSDGTVERLAWRDLDRVRIVTTNGGPWSEDLYFVLEGGTADPLVIGQMETSPDFPKRLLSLAAFDVRAFTKAMGSTRDAEFLCWESGGGETEAGPRPAPGALNGDSPAA